MVRAFSTPATPDGRTQYPKPSPPGKQAGLTERVLPT